MWCPPVAIDQFDKSFWKLDSFCTYTLHLGTIILCFQVLYNLLTCLEYKQFIVGKSILFQAAKFLLKFGYLDILKEQDSAGANDPSSPAFKNAVKRLQRFGNIPVTGLIDSKTLELISKSRCGVKDPSMPSSRRKRSVGEFNLQGTKWEKLVCTILLSCFYSCPER